MNTRTGGASYAQLSGVYVHLKMIMEATEYGKAKVTVFPFKYFLRRILSTKTPKEEEHQAERKAVITHYLQHKNENKRSRTGSSSGQQFFAQRSL